MLSKGPLFAVSSLSNLSCSIPTVSKNAETPRPQRPLEPTSKTEGLWFSLDNDFSTIIRNIIRENASPRHVPHKIYEVTDIPYTMNGKRVEGVARWVLEGKDVPNLSSISNPECLKQYSELNNKKAL